MKLNYPFFNQSTIKKVETSFKIWKNRIIGLARSVDDFEKEFSKYHWH